METKPSQSVLAYRMSKDVSQGGGTARQSVQRSEGLGPQKRWLGSGKGQQARGREMPTEDQVGRAPFCTPPVLSCFGLCASSRPLPGRVTSRPPREPGSSYAKNVRAERGRAVPSDPAPNTPTAQRHAPTRPLPRSAVATATGLQAQSAVYSQPSARKLGWEAAWRTSLGGGGREPVIGHRGH